MGSARVRQRHRQIVHFYTKRRACISHLGSFLLNFLFLSHSVGDKMNLFTGRQHEGEKLLKEGGGSRAFQRQRMGYIEISRPTGTLVLHPLSPLSNPPFNQLFYSTQHYTKTLPALHKILATILGTDVSLEPKCFQSQTESISMADNNTPRFCFISQAYSSSEQRIFLEITPYFMQLKTKSL